MIHNWLKNMAGIGPHDDTKFSICNAPHMYEILHRYPAYQKNCTCECHNKENHDRTSQV